MFANQSRQSLLALSFVIAIRVHSPCMTIDAEFLRASHQKSRRIPRARATAFLGRSRLRERPTGGYEQGSA